MITKQALKRRVAALMVDFGIKGYVVRVGRAPGTAWAHCNYSKREIVFHPRLLECDWVFANQIALHELAHVFAGPNVPAHGREWLKIARSMGYRLGAKVPKTPKLAGEHKWVAVCETGLHSAIRYERGVDGAVMCRPCWDSGAGEVLVFWDKL